MKLRKSLLIFLTITPAFIARAADGPDLTVPLLPGETNLADIGIYRVLWQSYGRPPVEMPLSWTGHFDDRSGISYAPWGTVLGRRALLLHSPWRVPPGIVRVEYRLALPPITPIRLSFGVAMGPDVARPDRSDGVTFSCSLVSGGQERELLRKHQDKAEWIDFSFDLSPQASKTVVLILGAEPGPKNNAAFDYSFFGDARIAVGEGKERRADLLKHLTSTRAYRATAEAGLLPLANKRANGVTPSNILPSKNAIEGADGAWRFAYEGADCRVVYTYEPATGTLDDFRVQVDDGPSFQPSLGGGVTVEPRKPGSSGVIRARGGRAIQSVREKDRLNVLWEYDIEGRPLRIAWSFGIIGKALTISARCDEPRSSGFSLGEVGLAPLRRTFDVPYLHGQVRYLPVQNVFVCRYLDWTVSHASSCPQGVSTYDPRTDGARNPLLESGYVAVSPDAGEVLPNIPHPPSPHVATLGPLVMLDLWAHHKGTYQGDAENLFDLKDNGVDHLAIISHDWQCHGYDVKLPDHLPANARYGGDEGMKLFGRAANECGYLWSLHENYIDLYPDAPSYDSAARVLLADGSPSKAWFNPGTGVQSFGLKTNRALGYARQNSPEIHSRFGTTAAYLDVHTCVPPWHQLDHEAGQPMAAMALAKVKFDGELFQFLREAHGGPLFGEGANQFYWAGLCDGVEAQVAGGEDHAPLLDFDLLKLHPQMVNHGMGYYERWFRRGYSHELGRDTGTMEQIDKYRAQELAYGHAGFIGSSQTDNVQWVAREHHLLHPVQRLYGAARVAEIRYEVEGKLVTASAALVAGDTLRQRIRYESGLTLWVNWRAEPWLVEGRTLPQWGFLALGPQTEVSTTLRGGKFADLAECPEYVFVDARTSFNMPYLRARKDIEPRLRSFQYVGGNRVRVTYEWIVNDTLEDDYHCFVHGVSREGTGERIAFQGDHALPKPTSGWRKGEIIVDGPHEMVVSGESGSYDLVMGLYKGARVPLKGIREPGERILVATVKVERKGGNIAGIEAGKATRAERPEALEEADFRAHLNPEGAWIDFGKVATDGSVKIQRERDRLTIFPYPREKRFRLSLDLKALAPACDPSRLRVLALAARTRKDLGPVEFKVEGGRLLLTLGAPGAGRYVVKWE